MSKNSEAPGAEEAGNAEPQGNDVIFRALALRLLRIPSAGDGNMQHRQLLVGSLPKPLPVELPLPMPNEVLGTLVRDPDWFEIIVDVNRSPNEVMTFYEEELMALGWSRPDSNFGPGGIFPARPSNEVSAVYCRGPRGPALYLIAESPGDSKTHLRIDLEMKPHHQLCSPPETMEHPRLIRNPTLHGPIGDFVKPLGGGGASNYRYSTSVVRTALTNGELLEHFASQLEDFGWVRKGHGVYDPAAWAGWGFEGGDGQPWLGLLMIIQADDDREVKLVNLHTYVHPELND